MQGQTVSSRSFFSDCGVEYWGAVSAGSLVAEIWIPQTRDSSLDPIKHASVFVPTVATFCHCKEELPYPLQS